MYRLVEIPIETTSSLHSWTNTKQFFFLLLFSMYTWHQSSLSSYMLLLLWLNQMQKGLIRKNCETIHHHHKYDDFANTFETTNTKLCISSVLFNVCCCCILCLCYFRLNMIRELLFSAHYSILTVVVVVIHRILLSAFHLQHKLFIRIFVYI